MSCRPLPLLLLVSGLGGGPPRSQQRGQRAIDEQYPQRMNRRDDPLAHVIERAGAAGITASRDTTFFDEPTLRIEIPNGRTSRTLYISPKRVDEFAAVGFESVRFLGNYDAIVDGETGVIEARVESNLRSGPTPYILSRIPGAEPLVPAGGHHDGDSDGDEDDARASALYRTGTMARRLRVGDEAKWLELSPPSATFRAMSERARVTLKLPAEPGIQHDDAVKLLERVAFPFFFELDLRYGQSLDLGRMRALQRPRRKELIQEPPVYPTSTYGPEPLALYRYGRSAQGLPLLEFLAYYQALEYFFPYFSAADGMRSIRAEIADPRFQVSDDRSIERLLNLARSASRGGSEREQMRATVASCADSALLVDLLTPDDRTKNHFCGNRQTIKGVKRIQLDGETDLRHQVADRMYDIRCRVVHAKQDGGDSGIDLLLPTSSEAASLGPDIDVARALAERAIVMRARPA